MQFLVDGLTPGGEEARVIHFADRKPFQAAPGDPEWPYLCWQPQRQHERRQADSADVADDR